MLKRAYLCNVFITEKCMKITEAVFATSSFKYEQCPEEKWPEYAFIGRSNVGKSSLINALTNKKSLAKTSGRPGKTQLINHFAINKEWYLVDLPGYGWAQTGKDKRNNFERMINEYLTLRKVLCCTFVLVDIRHDPQKNDLAFMQRMAEAALPFAIIFTKADKIKDKLVAGKVKRYLDRMLEEWEEAPQHFVTSADGRTGLEEVLRFISGINQEFKALKK